MLPHITRLMNLTEDEIRNHPELLVNAFDHEHRILFWNAHCESLFGIKEQDALGKKLEDLVPGARDNNKMIHLEKALSGESVYIDNDKYEKKDGRYTQIVLPLKNNSGRVVAAVNIVRNLPTTEPLSI
jgi:PAS domain S-box-containing protein